MMASIRGRVERLGAAITRFAKWLAQHETLGPMPAGAESSAQEKRISPLHWLLANEKLPYDASFADRPQTRKNLLAYLFQQEELGLGTEAEELGDVSGSFFRNLLKRESLGFDEPQDTYTTRPRNHLAHLMKREVLGEEAEAETSHKHWFLSGVFERETLEMGPQAPEEEEQRLPALVYIFQRETLAEGPVSEKVPATPSFLRMVFGTERLGNGNDSQSFNSHDEK